MDSWYNLPSNNINVIYPTGGGTAFNPAVGLTVHPTTTPTPAPDPQTQSAITGIKPEDVAKATYGKIIPLVVGGMPRIGGYIIYGPNFTTVSSVPYVTFGVSMGLQANPEGEREIREIRFDGVRVWTIDGGSTLAGLVFRSTQGTETQEPDALLVAQYGDAAPAFRGQVCIFIEGLDLTPFNGSVPFVSAVIADITDGADPTDGLNLGTALETIANSPYVNVGADFEAVDVTARVLAIIDAENTSFLDLLRRFARLLPLDVVQTDKLRLIERPDVAPDIVLTEGRILAGEDLVKIDRQPEQGVAQELEFIYIDIDRDYEFTPQRARRPLAPIAVTSSRAKETINLPVVTTASEAIAWVTLRKYWDEVARQQVSFTALPYGMAIEPGAMVALKLPLRTYVVRVSETLHDARGTVQCVGTPILRCSYLGFDDGPEIGDDGTRLFIIGGNTIGADPLLESSPDGATWTARTSDPATDGYWTDSADFGEELFFVVGADFLTGAIPKLSTSPDGVTWTERTLPAITGFLSGAGAGPLAISVGRHGDGSNDPIIITSPDGITWTERTHPFTDNALYGATYGSGVYVVVGGDDASGPPIVATSTDGVTWTERTPAPTTGAWYGGVASNGSLFVAFGEDTDTSVVIIATSPNGITWTQRTHPGEDRATSIVYGGGYFVIAGVGGLLMSSPDGITWTNQLLPEFGLTFFDVGYSNGMWAVCGGVGARVFTSEDVVTWTERTQAFPSDSTLYTIRGRG